MKKLVLSSLLVLSLSLFFVPSTCAAAYTITEEQLSELETQLQALSENNETLMNLLNESESDLSEATRQLNESKKQTELLRAQLATLKRESDAAQKSLATANAELQKVCESVQQLERKKRRIERQRNLWQIIAAVLGGVCIAK